MENKKPFLPLAFLSLLLFGGIIWISQPSRHRGDGTQRYFELSIESDGSYDALAYDFASVRDTLDHHLHGLASQFPAAHYSWQTTGFEGKEASALRSSIKVQFGDAAQRLHFLESVLSSGMMEVAIHAKDMTGLYGYASGDLPLAGAGAGNFHFQGWKFRMNMSVAMEEMG